MRVKGKRGRKREEDGNRKEWERGSEREEEERKDCSL